MDSAIGFTVKSGWAAAVVVTGGADEPRVLASARVELSDPAKPELRQPYHDGFGKARAEGPGLSQMVRAVRRFGTAAAGEFIRTHPAGGVAIVAGSLADPASIANDHIRIHTLEGRLFRGVIEEAASKAGLVCVVLRERDLGARAARALGRPERELRAAVQKPGGGSGPWRAEQKAAALAAWMLLAGAGAKSGAGS